MSWNLYFNAGFIIRCQSANASQDSASTPQAVAAAAALVKKKAASAAKEKEKEKGWFQIDDAKNTNVYVSGLPLDTTDDEFEKLMSKYGVIMKDPLTNKLKCKLYKENEEVKGDGRCGYLMVSTWSTPILFLV